MTNRTPLSPGSSRKILQAQEEEHKRISREIHDDLGQSLVTLKMLIQSHQAGYSKNKKDAARTKAFRKILRYLDSIIEKTRALAAGLRPPALDVLGLTASLRSLVNDFRCRKDLHVRFHCIFLDHLVFQGEVINLYRIVQEALANIIRHARASRVSIVIKRLRKNLRITIMDNGRGLRGRGRIQGSSAGIGFSTMSERARLLGGTFEVKSAPGRGTALIINIPVHSR